jgi:hypothetical protein
VKTTRWIFTALLVVLLMAVGRMIQWHTSQQAERTPKVEHPTVQQSSFSPQGVPQLVNAQQQGAEASTIQRAVAGAAQEKETEQHLGPFSISGGNYTVVLHKRTRQPGGTQETGDTVVAIEIRDAADAILYERRFPYQEGNDGFSDAWFVGALTLNGANGTGLLVSYDFDSEPSAPEPEPTSWWQVFGVVDGKFKPFGPAIYVEGGLVDEDSAARSHFYRSAGPVGPHGDLLQFRVWTGHFRLVFPVRVDWAEGELTAAQPCEQTTTGAAQEACQYKVLPESGIGGETFVSFCPSPNEQCNKPQRVGVSKDSKVELLVAQVPVKLTEGMPSGPSGNVKRPMDAMDDARSIVLAASGNELWLKVRIDGKEGWLHTEEDFDALGLPHEQ